MKEQYDQKKAKMSKIIINYIYIKKKNEKVKKLEIQVKKYK